MGKEEKLVEAGDELVLMGRVGWKPLEPIGIVKVTKVQVFYIDVEAPNYKARIKRGRTQNLPSSLAYPTPKLREEMQRRDLYEAIETACLDRDFWKKLDLETLQQLHVVLKGKLH